MTPSDVQEVIRRLTTLEIQAEERERSRLGRAEDLLRRLGTMEMAVTAMAGTVTAMGLQMGNLSQKTTHHLRVGTCLNASKSALQYGSMGGGVVATVVLIGKLLNFW